MSIPGRRTSASASASAGIKAVTLAWLTASAHAGYRVAENEYPPLLVENLKEVHALVERPE